MEPPTQTHRMGHDSLFSIVAEAMDLSGPERDAFLAQACAGNTSLEQRVRDVLSERTHLDGFMSEPAAEAAALLDDLISVEREDDTRASDHGIIPDAIGRYAVLRQIGRGGMGNVYLAEQQLEGVTREVAVKLIKRGMDTEAVVGRFRAERSILARLDHPNIARLLDAGTTDDGRAFFVMEYVDGSSLTEYCRRSNLDTAERLALFETVCRAVHHAHQNLIVHRDIKPSNILVTEDGKVKLLDFGIAKVLSDKHVDFTVPATALAGSYLTPDYASPEQLQGLPISTATDVYSLGILLYEMLAGARPFQMGAESPVSYAHRICREPAKAPSSVSSSAVASELDTIVLKAMRKEPAERYASVEQFREDIARFRSGAPVLAKPSTVRYRLRKWLQRHRVPATAAAAVFAGVVALTTWYIISISHQRAAAESALVQSESVKNFVVGLLEQGTNNGELVKEERLRAVNLLVEPALEQMEALDDDPLGRVAVLNVIGQVLTTNGSSKRAIPVLHRAIREGAESDLPIDVVSTSEFELARAYFASGVYDSAHVFADRAFHRQRELLGPSSEATLNSQKYAAWSAPDSTDRAQRVAEVIAQFELAYGEPSVELAGLLSDIGQGSPDAIRHFERAIDNYERTTGLEHPLAAVTFANYSLALEASDPERSFELQQRAANLLGSALGSDHPMTLTAQHNVGAMFVDRYEYRKADSILTRALAGYESLDSTVARPALLYYGGVAKNGLGEPGLAADMMRRSFEALPATHGMYPVILKTYVRYSIAADRTDEAREYLAGVQRTLRELDPEHRPDITGVLALVNKR